MNGPDRPLTPQTGVAFRRVTLGFAALLAVQSIWLLVPELTRPTIHGLPVDAASAAVAAKQRGWASVAASSGLIRGDLWADAAYTYADLLWNDIGPSAGLTQALERAHTILERALDDAPHRSSAWLLLAGLATRYPSLNVNAMQALKTSYYTGPSEQNLMPSRLLVAVQSDFLNDAEIREFVTRDVRLFVSHGQQSAIDAAYKGGSATGKAFIKQVVNQMSPPASAAPRAAPH